MCIRVAPRIELDSRTDGISNATSFSGYRPAVSAGYRRVATRYHTAPAASHQPPAAALPAITALYRAVPLANGQVFFGRIDKAVSAGRAYAVLDDVFYVQARRDEWLRIRQNALDDR